MGYVPTVSLHSFNIRQFRHIGASKLGSIGGREVLACTQLHELRAWMGLSRVYKVQFTGIYWNLLSMTASLEAVYGLIGGYLVVYNDN